MDTDKNIKIFQRLYSDLEYQFNNEYLLGHESWEGIKDTASKVGYVGSSIFSKLKSLTTKLIAILDPFIKKLLKRYNSLMDLWKYRLDRNVRYINIKEFSNHSVSVVPHDQLVDRIECVNAIHEVLSNITKVVHAPIDPELGWRTKELDIAYNRLLDIGFSLSRYNLLKKVDKEYDTMRTKQPIGYHGYTPDTLQQLVDRSTNISKYITPSYTRKLSETYTTCANKLIAQESILTSLEGDRKATLLHEIEIRTTRLWWISHFMKISFIISNDIVVDILRLCKLADKYIEIPEEN